MYKQAKASGAEICVTWADATTSTTSRIWRINVYVATTTDLRRRGEGERDEIECS